MANILLKDKNGANIVYRDIDYLSLSTAEGGTVRFNERTVEVISVTELPTEEINDGAVYKVTTKDENDATIVKFYVHNEENGEWSEIATGAKLSEKAITENGEYVPEGSYDGFSKVTVDIDTFTDVEEFPMENIDQEAIYRVTTKDADTGSVVIVDAELNSVEAGAALQAAGTMRSFTYFVVDELPAVEALEAPVTDDASLITANAYILRSTGVPYYTSADDAGVLSLAEMVTLGEYEFKGALPAEVTEAGMYSVITVGTTYTTYGLFDADDTKTVLEYNAEEGWVECGGRAKLTELVATANGIYDNPQIVIEPDIAVGNTIQFKKDITIDDLPESILETTSVQQLPLAASDDSQCILIAGPRDGIFVLMIQKMDFDENGDLILIEAFLNEGAVQFMGAQVGIAESGWYSIDASTEIATPLDEPPSITIEDVKLVHDITQVEILSMIPAIFISASPADGWNKVTVNIPNADTIVEIKELPETVEADKIYKITESLPPKYEIYMPTNENGFVPYSQFITALGGSVEYIILETEEDIPSSFVKSVDPDFYVYIVLSNGAAGYSTDGTTIKTAPMLSGLSMGGVITSLDEAVDNEAVYILKIVDKVITYGVANPTGSNKLYEYTSDWAECASGDMAMAKVDTLPTENLDSNKVYCIKNEIEEKQDICAVSSGELMSFSSMVSMYESFGISTSVNYYMVDTLPTSPEISVLNTNEKTIIIHCYVLNSLEQEPCMSKDGTTYMPLSEETVLNFGTFKGFIKSMDEVESPVSGTYYFLVQDYSLSYTYGIPNDGDNKTIMVYKNGAWVRFVEETPAAEPTDPEATT